MAAETSQTLDRGLRVLAALAAGPEPLSITALAGRLEVHRTVVHRLVATLEQHGLVRRDAQGLLSVGPGVLPWAVAARSGVRDLAVPVLRELAEELGATAHLTVADGEEAHAAAVVEPSWTDFHVAYREGARHPLRRGAAGRAILLLRDEESAGTHPAYVVSSGELQPGAQGLAAPVRGVPGLEASVGVVTLGESVDESVVAPRVLAAAEALAHALLP